MTEDKHQSTKKRKSAKRNVGVLIDVELWKRFKIRCLEEGRGEGELLGHLISKYLEKNSDFL